MTETWKPIADWETYEVSNLGNIRKREDSRHKKAGELIFQHKRFNGYVQVMLHKNGSRKRFLVHRLVATAFHGAGESDYHEVAHLNGVRDDNQAENLAWKTHAENELDKHKHGTILRGSQIRNAKLNETQVSRIKELIFVGEKLTQIANMYGVSISTISLIKKGWSWRHA